MQFISCFYPVLQPLFVEERHHWVPSVCIMGGGGGGVKLYDSASTKYLSSTLENQLAQIYGSTIDDVDNGLLVSIEPIQQQKGV